MDQPVELVKKSAELIVWVAFALVTSIHAVKFVRMELPNSKDHDPSKLLKFAAMITVAAILLTVFFAVTLNTGREPAEALPTANSGSRLARAAPVEDDETAAWLKAFVKDAILWETLSLYGSPDTCDSSDVKRFFLQDSKAYMDVAESASRLTERGWHYANPKVLLFQFVDVQISEDGLSAKVRTRERYWLPLATANGRLVSGRSADSGPYEIQYQLVNVDGRWFIQSNNSPHSGWKPNRITCKNWPE